MRMHSSLLGLGDCIPGQPSDDPNCYTTPAYIRALNLQQVADEQAQGLISKTADSAGCYDEYMAPGPNFNPDAYNKCIGAQDVISPGGATLAASGVTFANNVLLNPAATPAPAAPAPITQQQVKTLTNAPPVNAGTAPASTVPPAGSSSSSSTGFNLSAWLQAASLGSIPNWMLVAGVGGFGLFLYSRSR